MKIAKPTVHLVDSMGSDLSVVNAARVSFAKESEWEGDSAIVDADGDVMVKSTLTLAEKDKKLINYLAKHQHWSPFAHNSLTFRIKAPIFVARQLVKHQVGGVWNEVSRRYVDDEPEFVWPKEWRGKPENAKQGSSGVVSKQNQEYYSEYLERIHAHAAQCYESMIKDGVAPEQARMVLPQSMYTSYYVTGSLAAWARAYKQRIDPYAQFEIQCLAEQWGSIIQPLFPVSWTALTSE